MNPLSFLAVVSIHLLSKQELIQYNNTMLLVGSRLLNIPVMGLQTGSELARTIQPVIDPASLSIIAYTVSAPLLQESKIVFLRIADARELSDIGFIIDSIDELVTEGDVFHLDDVYALHFPLVGMKVVDEHGHKLGKIYDFTIDVGDFSIQQLSVKRPFVQRLNDPELLIHRSQIVEINGEAIIVHSKAEVPEHTRATAPGSYVNPFRKPKPAEPREE